MSVAILAAMARDTQVGARQPALACKRLRQSTEAGLADARGTAEEGRLAPGFR